MFLLCRMKTSVLLKHFWSYPTVTTNLEEEMKNMHFLFKKKKRYLWPVPLFYKLRIYLSIPVRTYFLFEKAFESCYWSRMSVITPPAVLKIFFFFFFNLGYCYGISRLSQIVLTSWRWNRLLMEMIESPSVEAFKKSLDDVLRDMV